MSRTMVVLPLAMAKSLVEEMQGSEAFDLKEGNDLMTVNRLNKNLNRKEGEERGYEPRVVVPEPEPETPVVSTVKRKRDQHEEPASAYASAVASTPKRKNPKAKVRMDLAKTDAFNRKTKEVISNGQEIKGSNIDAILDHAYAPNNANHPKGSQEIASRMKFMQIANLPNTAFQALINKSTPPTRRRGQWKQY